MQLLVLGASGRTGQLIVEHALSKGHTVIALVRSKSNFSLASRVGVTVVEGTPLKLGDMKMAFTTPSIKPDAVLVALSMKRVTDSPFSALAPNTPPRLMEDSVANALTVMKEQGTKRIVIMNSWGAGNSWQSLNFLLRPVFKYTPMSQGLKAHNAIDEETRKSGLEFVLLRPTILTDLDAGPVKVHPADGTGVGFMPKISRGSVAEFMVAACQGDEFVGTSPVISN
ncbi:NAD-dependent epimerase/dehydratase-like protein [Xylariaceae sp. FL0255]|nr:NAD-dependent epimerase/dehydratase-like protein [Xylariaceae sp. FL0255]